jgi:hypothetical protein
MLLAWQRAKRLLIFLPVVVLSIAGSRAGFSRQPDITGIDQPVSPMLLRMLEQEAMEGARSLVNPETRQRFFELLGHAQLQARFLDTPLDCIEEWTTETGEGPAPADIRNSRQAIADLGAGDVDAALDRISRLVYGIQLATIRNATAWCIETGKTEWINPILEFDFDSRARENEVWSTKAQIEETIRPLCLRDLGLRCLLAGDLEQAAKLSLEAVKQILEFSGGAEYRGILNDLDTYLDLAERCGVMKEAYELIRPQLLDGTLATFAADSIALRLARAGLKDELGEMVDAGETDEKRNGCNAAAAYGFAIAGDRSEAMRRAEMVRASITDQQLQALGPESFSYLVGACCLAGRSDLGSALIKQRFASPGENDNKYLIALIERADVEFVLPLLEQGNVFQRFECAVGFALASKRQGKEALASSWLRAKAEDLRQSSREFSWEDICLVAAALASAWGILGDINEVNAIMMEQEIPDYSDPTSREAALSFERSGGYEFHRIVAENMAKYGEPEILFEWATSLEHPICRGHAALGLFQGFAERNHRLEGWFPR